MKKDSMIRMGFTPSPGAKERIWQQVQAQTQPTHTFHTVRWVTAAACVLVALAIVGIYTRPAAPDYPSLTRGSGMLELGNVSTPRGLELLDDYVPYQ